MSQADTPNTEPEEVVLLIHGTFASAETEEGTAWWQTEGRFRNKLSARLNANARVSVESFIWSGRNNQGDRAEAGTRLLTRLDSLEQAGIPYHIVCHSHGGSVAWNALVATGCKAVDCALPQLKSWTTVGTPFLQFRTAWKSVVPYTALLAAMGYCVVFPALWLTGYVVDYVPPAAPVSPLESSVLSLESRVLGCLRDPTSLTVVTLCVSLLLGVASVVLHILDIGQLHRRARRAGDFFARRWLGLSSRQDEAIHGLLRTIELTDQKLRHGDEAVLATRKEASSTYRTQVLLGVGMMVVPYATLAWHSVWPFLREDQRLGLLLSGAVGLFFCVLAAGMRLSTRVMNHVCTPLGWSMLARQLQGTGGMGLLDVKTVSVTPTGCDDRCFTIPERADSMLINAANERLEESLHVPRDGNRDGKGGLERLRVMLSQTCLGGNCIAASVRGLGNIFPSDVLVHCSYWDSPDIFDLIARHIEMSGDHFGRSAESEPVDKWIKEFKENVGRNVLEPLSKKRKR